MATTMTNATKETETSTGPIISAARIRHNIERVLYKDIQDFAGTFPEDDARRGIADSAYDRFSSGVAVAFGAMADTLLRDMLIFAIKQGISQKKKIIEVEHLYSEDVRGAPFFPLVRDVDVVRQELERTAAARAAVNERVAACRSFAEFMKSVADIKHADKAAYIKQFKEKMAPETDSVQELIKAPEAEKKPKEKKPKETKEKKPDAESEDDEEKGAPRELCYKHYVGGIYKQLKAAPEFAVTKLSYGLKTHLDIMLIQLFDLLANAIRINLRFAGIKTINLDICKQTIAGMIVPFTHFSDKCEYLADAKVPHVAKTLGASGSYYEVLCKNMDAAAETFLANKAVKEVARKERKAVRDAAATTAAVEAPKEEPKPAPVQTQAPAPATIPTPKGTPEKAKAAPRTPVKK